MKILSVRRAPDGMRNTLGWVSADLGNGIAVFGVKICRRNGGIYGFGDTSGRRILTIHPEMATKIAEAAFGEGISN